MAATVLVEVAPQPFAHPREATSTWRFREDCFLGFGSISGCVPEEVAQAVHAAGTDPLVSLRNG